MHQLPQLIEGETMPFGRASPLRIAVGQAEAQIDAEAVGALSLETDFEFCVLRHSCATNSNVDWR